MVPEDSRKPVPTGSELVSSFQILSLVGDALHRISDGSDSTSVTRALTQVRDRFARCESTLDRLAGGSLTRLDQLAEIRRLNAELERKRVLVQRYAEHDLVARVLAQKAVPQKEEDAMEDDAREEGDTDEMMKMEEEVFAEVDGIEKEVAEDVLMGLDI